MPRLELPDGDCFLYHRALDDFDLLEVTVTLLAVARPRVKSRAGAGEHDQNEQRFPSFRMLFLRVPSLVRGI